MLHRADSRCERCREMFFRHLTSIDDLDRPSGYDKAIDTEWEYLLGLCMYYGGWGTLKHNLRRRLGFGIYPEPGYGNGHYQAGYVNAGVCNPY